VPRVELACDGLKTRWGKGVDWNLCEELTGSRGRRDGDSKESFNISEVNL